MEDTRSSRKRVHALIVEPDEETYQALMEAFQEPGYFTDGAQSGKKAIDMVKEFFYNFAVVELQLPDMRGLDFLKALKGIHPDTSVIIITGTPSLENSVDALNAGASAYLVKPIQMDQLRQQVSEILTRQKAIMETRELLFAERKKREFYQYLSIRDGLTELYNHRHFHELFNQEMAPAIRYNRPLGLLMIDLDDFKKFNDSYGHPAGDQALQYMARLFRENCRRVDHICRYGGEEFAIITPETSGKNAVYLARRLLNKVRKTKIQIYDSLLEAKLTLSIGLASFPADANNKEDLILKADQSLLQAKKEGKDRCYPASF